MVNMPVPLSSVRVAAVILGVPLGQAEGLPVVRLVGDIAGVEHVEGHVDAVGGPQLQGRGDIEAIPIREMQFPVNLFRVVAGSHVHAVDPYRQGIVDVAVVVARSPERKTRLSHCAETMKPTVSPNVSLKECEYAGRGIVRQLIDGGVQRESAYAARPDPRACAAECPRNRRVLPPRDSARGDLCTSTACTSPDWNASKPTTRDFGFV